MFKNRGLVALVVIILLLLLGTGAYLMMSKSSAPKTQTANTNPTQTQTKSPTSVAKSLIDLLALGQTQQCTFNVKGTASTQGTIYMSGGKVRGSFTVTASDGKQNQMNMIRNGDTSYIWGGALPQGIKMTMSLQELSNNQQASQYYNPNQKVDYTCSPWVADDSQFNPPANVKFMDISQMMQQAKPTGTVSPTGTTQTQTGASPCDSITDPTAKAACVNAMHQNGY